MRKLSELNVKAADVCGGEEAEFMTLIREDRFSFLIRIHSLSNGLSF